VLVAYGPADADALAGAADLGAFVRTKSGTTDRTEQG
jgi:hypothetical protein